MKKLRDKHALITSGNRGIGLATAQQFLKEGARVAHAVVFLASDECAFTLGSELQSDGGMGTL